MKTITKFLAIPLNLAVKIVKRWKQKAWLEQIQVFGADACDMSVQRNHPKLFALQVVVDRLP